LVSLGETGIVQDLQLKSKLISSETRQKVELDEKPSNSKVKDIIRVLGKTKFGKDD